MQVVITDTREKWMIAEDNLAACMNCRMWKRCQSRIGYDCKLLGGEEIPKLR